MKVAVLGSTGMLGQTVSRFLSESLDIDVVSTSRKKESGKHYFDASSFDNLDEFLNSNKFDYIVNCIGIIKPNIKETDSKSVVNAIRVNSLFPHLLAERANMAGSKVIQIATDCVFSGINKIPYDELSQHDPVDVYGKTKSLGEVSNSNFLNLRVSIVGPESNTQLSLLEWFRAQPRNGSVNGFVNHTWNGITTLHFAKCIAGIVKEGIFKSGTFHLVPNDIVNKFQLLNYFASCFERLDLKIFAVESEKTINRTLGTINREYNLEVWNSAGYSEAPSIEEMIRELKYWTNR